MKPWPIITLLLCACPPAPKPPPFPDASDAAVLLPDGATTPCQAACNVIAGQLGCGWASQNDCPSTLARIEASRLRRLNDGNALTCVELAMSSNVAELGIGCGQ